MAVGTRIKNYLDARGISQAWLSEQSGIFESRMSLLLNDKRRMRIDDYEKIIGVLKLPAGTFIEPVEELNEEEA